jgi:hypothetical protein
MGPLARRLALVVAFVLATTPAWLSSQEKKASEKLDYYKGEVIPFAEYLKKLGSKIDADAAPAWMVLVADDGKAYPLLKDTGSRMFFQDPALLRRPMRLTGRLVPGTGVLQVINVHSYKNGKLHGVYYWCDICSIRGYEAGICDCCGGPVERREEPMK